MLLLINKEAIKRNSRAQSKLNENTILLAEWFQCFSWKMIPEIYWNHSARVSLFWLGFANVDLFLIHHCARAGVYPSVLKFKAVKTKTKQRNTCRTIPVNLWNHFARKTIVIIAFIWYKNRETRESFCQ